MLGRGGRERGAGSHSNVLTLHSSTSPLLTRTHIVKKFARNPASAGLHSGVTPVIFQPRKEAAVRAPSRNHKAKFWFDV